MSKKFGRDARLGPKGSEIRKLLLRPGNINLGKEGLTEEAAQQLNQLLDDVEAGKVEPITREELVELEKNFTLEI